MRSSSKRAIAEKGHDRHTKVPTWNPPLVLNESPLLMDSSIRDFYKEKARYVANALEKPLLLLDDMADLRIMKKHKVFLTLKRDLALVSSSLFFFLLSIPVVSSYHFKNKKKVIQVAHIGEQLP